MSRSSTSDRHVAPDQPAADTAREGGSRTVRDVLSGLLRGFCANEDEVEHYLAPTLAALREVLTTGQVWRTREIAARLLEVGDVLVDREGLLWSVTGLAETDDGKVSPELVRGDAIKTPAFAPKRLVRILLSAQDHRALSILEQQLGAELVDRKVA